MHRYVATCNRVGVTERGCSRDGADQKMWGKGWEDARYERTKKKALTGRAE